MAIQFLRMTLGLVLNLGHFGSIAVQIWTMQNCKTCQVRNGIPTCLECEDYFTSNEAGTACCSDGCLVNANGYRECDVTTHACLFSGCVDGFIGAMCERCINVVKFCDSCSKIETTGNIICTRCDTNHYLNDNQQSCCANQGCNVCTGTNNEICSSCKVTYFLYNTTCDTCGNNCRPPANGSARCDPTNGHCYLGCNSGWHGNTCHRLCDIGNCDTCFYDEPRDNLTCIDCEAGRYVPYCGFCSANCAIGPNTDICDHSGTCYDGCTPGWRGNKCDVECKDAAGMQNCLECDRYSLTCTSCRTGYWGPTCQYECNMNCVSDINQDRPCSIVGECTLGCKANYYKSDCSGYCPNCRFDVCNRDTGDCTQPACDPGYFGVSCNQSCPIYCRDVGTPSANECQFANGTCINGCDDGFHGAYCTFACSQNCAASPSGTETGPLCNQNDASCTHQCKPGFFSATCESTCLSTCMDNRCDVVEGTCLECDNDNPGYLCPSGSCPVGTHGLLCDGQCPNNCQDGTCDRYAGTCFSCKNTYYGSTCNQYCPNCNGDTCFQANGVCSAGCKNGFYTLSCMNTCLYTGCLECDRTAGTCNSCKTGLYGTTCNQTCAKSCSPDSNDQNNCNLYSGNCDSGSCLQGYYTPTCTEQCSQHCGTTDDACEFQTGICTPCEIGWFGQQCNQQCSGRCYNNDCENEEDQCRLGCTDGYWGAGCANNCQSNCDNRKCDINTGSCSFGCVRNEFWGQTCDTNCNGNCVGHVCNRNGSCANGCKTGYYGEQCQYYCPMASRCTDGTCGQFTGQCPDCDAVNKGPNCPPADCPDGFSGVDCTDPCPSSNCLINRCNRYDRKTCIGCGITRWDDFCGSSCPNCKQGTGCNQLTGDCDEGCTTGWYQPKCDRQCDSNCGTCERTSGACIKCADDRYGNNCDLFCSSHCKPANGVITCAKSSGACTSAECLVGYWGAACDATCNLNCKPDSLNNRICRYLDGRCENGCEPTYFGATCHGRCSTRCKDQLCASFEDTCTLGCADGYYGSLCSQQCSSHCAGTGRCDPGNGRCLEGCDVSFFGATCDDACLNTCLDNTCDDGGGCADCKVEPAGPNCRITVCQRGFYGTTCELECPGKLCKDSQCHRLSGNCDNGCETNFFGPLCTSHCTCNATGSSACLQNGTCVCNQGRYGHRCGQFCSAGCAGGICQRDGTCSNRCLPGYFGGKCLSQCTHCLNLECNFQGVCNQTCSVNCKDGVCEQASGRCSKGCNSGYYGSDCSETCPNCLDGGCNADGVCTGGCIAGKYGQKCSANCPSTCIYNLCNQNDGVCTASPDQSPTSSVVVGISVGGAAVVVCAIVICVIVIWARRAINAAARAATSRHAYANENVEGQHGVNLNIESYDDITTYDSLTPYSTRDTCAYTGLEAVNPAFTSPTPPSSADRLAYTSLIPPSTADRPAYTTMTPPSTADIPAYTTMTPPSTADIPAYTNL